MPSSIEARAGIAVALLAAVFVAPARAEGPAAAGEVDLQGNRVYVLVPKKKLGHDHAMVGPLKAGRVRLGAAEAAGSLVLDMAGLRADTPEARTLLSLRGKTAFDRAGTFTRHGVSRPLSVRAEVEAAGPVDRLWGSAAVKPTDHGMKPFPNLGSVIRVADELAIYGDIRILSGRSR